jgi:hypothetical protein
VSNDTISVAWSDQSDNEEGFSIRFRGERAGSSDHTGTKSAGRNAVSASLTGLRSNYEYTISVVAFNAGGESQQSNEVRATTTGTTPPAFVSAGVEPFSPGSQFKHLRIRGNNFQAEEQVSLKITTKVGNNNPFTEIRQTTAGSTGSIDFKYSGSGGGVCGTIPTIFQVQATGITSSKVSNVANAGC